MILSAQSIRRLSDDEMMILPFHDRTIDKRSGMSFGLGPCTYDVRIDQDLIVPPKVFTLASTVECFKMPINICGEVMDKSSLVRLGLSVHNTHIDPGWRGYLTLELFNESSDPITLHKGTPIAQIKFQWLDYHTEEPYNSKYQDQERGPQGAKRETP